MRTGQMDRLGVGIVSGNLYAEKKFRRFLQGFHDRDRLHVDSMRSLRHHGNVRPLADARK